MSSFIKKYLPVLSIPALAFLIYGNSIRNGFVYDDVFFISENSFIRDFNNIPKLFSGDYFNLSGERTYRPIHTLAYFINYRLWKLDPAGWRVTAIFLHAFNGVLLCLLFRLLFRKLPGADKAGLLAGLIFTAHPVQTEVLNCMSFIGSIISSQFILLSFLSFILFRRGKALTFYILCLLFFILSMLTRQTAAVLPAVFIFYDLFLCESREKERKYRDAPLVYLPMLVIVLAEVYLNRRYFNPVVSASELNDFYPGYINGSVLTTLLMLPGIISYYVRILVFPVRQILIPSGDSLVRAPIVAFDPWTLLSLLFLAFLINRMLAGVRKRPEISFPIFLFFIFLLPVSNIFPIWAVMAERYLYLPAAGFAYFVAVCFAGIRQKRFPAPVVLALLCLYSVKTIVRNRDWADDRVLWAKTVSALPASYPARFNLANAYHKKGDYRAAVAGYWKAVSVNPLYKEAHFGLGNLYLELNDLENAARAYRAVLAIEPGFEKARNNLALVFYRQKEYKKAEEEYRKILEAEPGFAEAHANLGLVYYEEKKYDKALPEYLKALELSPEHSDLHFNLANLYLLKNRPADAVTEYGAALKLEPANNTARRNLAQLYFSMKMYGEALKEYEKLATYEPGDRGIISMLNRLKGAGH